MIISPANRLASVSEYYFAKKLREIRKRIADGEDIINLGIGNPDMMPSEKTLKKLISSVIEPGNHGYQPYKGIPTLRKAFSRWYKHTYGVDLNPEKEILPLMGSKEGILHISMAFLNPGDGVLIPNPGYPTYASNTRLLDARIINYDLKPENNWKPDFEALEQLDLTKVKLMWINYPHMPTGTPASKELFQQIIDFGKKHQILICHDNPYSLVLNKNPMSIFSIPGAMELCLELNSLSKSHNMAGWRIGMVAGKAEYLQEVLKVKSNMDSGMFMPMQQAAVEALHNSYEWHHERNNVYASRRETAWKILNALDCTYHKEQAGMFIWAEIPRWAEHSEHFAEQVLNDYHVFITPGFIFGTQGNRYIRISLCNSLERLEEAFNRVASNKEVIVD